MLPRQSKTNFSELIRTDPDTDGQQRKHRKQIQKLSQVKTHLGKLFGKSTFDKVQTSAGTMPSRFRGPTEEKCKKHAR